MLWKAKVNQVSSKGWSKDMKRLKFTKKGYRSKSCQIFSLYQQQPYLRNLSEAASLSAKS